MNKKLLILSCLIVLAFGMQMAFVTYDYITEVFDNKTEQPPKERPKSKSYLTLDARFTPRAIPDTLMVYNDKTGAWIPANVERVSVKVEEIRFSAYYMIPLGLSLMVLIIIACVHFCKLIIAVSKSKIFEWSNVRRLRYIGGILVVLFLFDFMLGVPFLLKAKEYVSLSDYYLDKEMDVLPLTLGLFLLLVAEIFAKGLRLKEEQELTI
jgi:hypothetical protein